MWFLLKERYWFSENVQKNSLNYVQDLGSLTDQNTGLTKKALSPFELLRLSFPVMLITTTPEYQFDVTLPHLCNDAIVLVISAK